MADNILKKQLDCISEDFLRGVFGRVGKPMWRALTHMFGAVTTGKSTLVTDIARTLRADSSRSEAKRAEEKVSGWLGRWDFAKPLNPWLLGKASGCASDDETYAVDFSDISKEFGGEVEDILHDQNDINESTRMQLENITLALSELQAKEPKAKPRRRIGFIQNEDK